MGSIKENGINLSDGADNFGADNMVDAVNQMHI